MAGGGHVGVDSEKITSFKQIRTIFCDLLTGFMQLVTAKTDTIEA